MEGIVGLLRDAIGEATESSAADAQFRRLLGALPVAAYTCDRHGRITYFNRHAVRLWGREPAPLESGDRYCGAWKLFSSAGLPIRKQDCWMAQGLRDGQQLLGKEIVIERPDGSRAYGLANVSIWRDSSGEVAGAVNVIVDLTESKQQELVLRESEQRYRSLVEMADEAILILENDHICYCNRSGLAMLGARSLADLLGKPASEIFHPDDRAASLARRQSILKTQQPVKPRHFRLIRLDGTEVDIESSASPCVYEGRPAIQAVFRDIGERKLAEQALREQTEILNALNEVGRVLTAELDLDRLTQAVADAGVKLCGAQIGAFFYNVQGKDGQSYQLNSLAGAERETFAHLPMPRNTELFRPTFEGTGIIRLADVADDPRYGRNPPYHGIPAGHATVRSYLAAPVMSRSGTVLGGLFFGHSERDMFHERAERLIGGLAAAAAVAMDNASLFRAVQRELADRQRAEEQRRQMEVQMRQAQKLESLGVLAGGVAHDFNNLLTAMLGFSSLAAGKLPPDSPARPMLQEIEKAAHRAAELTRQMLAYSGRSKLQDETFSLHAVVTEISKLLETVVSKKAVFRFDLTPATIRGDATQIRQIVMNLITNASDALEGRPGEITVRTGERFLSAPALRSPYLQGDMADGRYAFLEVRDSGCGMSEEIQSRIFDPFFTTKFTGRGLGLSAVLGIVRSHQGSIQVTSVPGQGTTIQVFFPCAATSDNGSPHIGRKAAESTTGVLSQPRSRGAVLVVDDEAAVCAYAQSVLEMGGFAAEVAHDGTAGLELFESRERQFVAAIVDLTMPRMDGWELLCRLRALSPELPVILMSGYSEWRQPAECGERPSGFLQKPFRPGELTAQVQRAAGV